MPPGARHLNSSHQPALLTHFLALSDRDSYLRFGGRLSTQAIDEYTRRIDYGSSTVLGIFGDELELLGVAHLCPQGGIVELGISVLPDHRRQGLGTLLLHRALGHARLIGASRLFMHCLAENAALMRLATAAGAAISFSDGEADGFIELPPGTAFSSVVEIAEEQMALMDWVLKAQRVAWQHALHPDDDGAAQPDEQVTPK
ncbi:MAG: GNAT family N-acetyltransferase [Pseudomonadota bacterium]